MSGLNSGSTVSSSVGTPLGLCVGTNEGSADGVDDGEVVGAAVGESIELSAHCPLQRHTKPLLAPLRTLEGDLCARKTDVDRPVVRDQKKSLVRSARMNDAFLSRKRLPLPSLRANSFWLTIHIMSSSVGTRSLHQNRAVIVRKHCLCALVEQSQLSDLRHWGPSPPILRSSLLLGEFTSAR